MPSPLLAIDHLQLQVADLEPAVDDYSLLLGAPPVWQGMLQGGAGAVFDAGNLFLCLSQATDARGLAGLCFRVDSRDRLRRRAGNLNLKLNRDSREDPLGVGLYGNDDARLDSLAPASARGLDLSFVERNPTPETAASSSPPGLDHIVISSRDADATALLFGARLGLDMRLDLSRPQWDARLLFFRCGDLIVEVLQQLSDTSGSGADRFYGLSWRVADVARAQARLSAAGFDVSDVREGRKPGTRVLTVHDRTAGVATLLIEHPRP